MTIHNIERGDTFIVRDDTHRGNHFTCVGQTDDGFFAGDTGGRMWKFKAAPGIQYRVALSQGATWSYRGRIDAESIVRE